MRTFLVLLLPIVLVEQYPAVIEAFVVTPSSNWNRYVIHTTSSNTIRTFPSPSTTPSRHVGTTTVRYLGSVNQSFTFYDGRTKSYHLHHHHQQHEQQQQQQQLRCCTQLSSHNDGNLESSDKQKRTTIVERIRNWKGNSSSTFRKRNDDDNKVRHPEQDNSSWFPLKRLCIAVLGLVMYGKITLASSPQPANAAVISSVAVAASAAAAAAGSSSTTGYLTLPTTLVHNNQLTIVAAVVVLNAIGNISLSAFGTGLQLFATWYMMNLSTFPLITKAITAGVIGITGDYMAQWLEYIMLQKKQKQNELKQQQQQRQQVTTTPIGATREQHRKSIGHVLSIHGNYHLRRGLSILADGMLISGPLMHIGYNYFEMVLPVASGTGGASTIAALSHVLADSILLDSIFIASTFIMTGLFEGYTPKQLIPQFKMDYIPSLKASWATSLALLPIEFICFRFLPLSFRVLAVNFIDVVWDAVISFMAHRNRSHNPIHATTATTTTTTSLSHHDMIDNSNSEVTTLQQQCNNNNNNGIRDSSNHDRLVDPTTLQSVVVVADATVN